MRKRFLIFAAGALVALSLAAWLAFRYFEANEGFTLTDADRAEAARKLGVREPPQPPPPAPIAPNHPVRLAVGGLGRGNDAQNRQLGDLIVVNLAGATGLELVERQEFDVVLKELQLSLSGLVRAHDAVRVGKLLRADWFLLGTEAKINGTNSLVVRVVDARTGILLDANMFPAEQSPANLAAGVARFIRQTRENAAHPTQRVYLAIGAFEDLSLNSRQASFPAQLRAYLMATYQNSNVALLEREYVNTLLREIQLDLAGLTEATDLDSRAVMQWAYWLVDGFYQSYASAGNEVELVFNVRRTFGRSHRLTFRGPPAEPLFREIKSATDEILNRETNRLILSRASEVTSQLVAGKDLVNNLSPVWGGNVSSSDLARNRRNANEAILSLETVLLLDPTNREARLFLARCLASPHVGRAAEGRDHYHAILAEPIEDKWSRLARIELEISFRWSDAEERSEWLRSRTLQSSNTNTTAFYRRLAESAAADVVIERGADSKAQELAEEKLFAAIRSSWQFVQNQGGILYGGMGMYDFMKAFPGNNSFAARRLAELFPRMKAEFPGFAPHLAAEALGFQLDTNTPLIAEFESALDWCTTRPEQVQRATRFWGSARHSAYPWCARQQLYPLAVRIMIAYRDAAEREPALTFKDEDEIALAFALMGAGSWKDALDTLTALPKKAMVMGSEGPWGPAFSVVLPARLAATCRGKLGLPAELDPLEFEMGTNCFCLHEPSAFAAGNDGLWVAIGDRLIKLDFHLRTNRVVRLPNAATAPVTCLSIGPSNIYVGTDGAGLMDFDSSSGHCRQLREQDGLLMDSISDLHPAFGTLWIGYRRGLGSMELSTRKFRSFIPSIEANLNRAVSASGPPRAVVQDIVSGDDPELWFLAGGRELVRHQIGTDVWQIVPDRIGVATVSVAADRDRLVRGLREEVSEIEITTRRPGGSWTNQVQKSRILATFEERERWNANTNRDQRISASRTGNLTPRCGLEVYPFKEKAWKPLDATALPTSPSTLNLEGTDLWVGGEGYIAVVDLSANRMRKISYVAARSVQSIQVAGGYVWAQYDRHLHRAPLEETR